MKRFCMIAACLILSVSMAACAVAGSPSEYPSANIRYKMTVEVETPEGIKTGSSVREISMVSRPKGFGENNDTHVKLERGEAVVVDLGHRGVLFVTLSGGGGVWEFFRAFPTVCAEGAVSRCGIKYYSSLQPGETSQLLPRYYPQFVNFKELNDPKSAQNVLQMKVCADPTGIPNNSHCIQKDRFQEIFGQEVRLSSVTVAVSQDPYVSIVDKWIPWLDARAKRPGTLGGGEEKPFIDPTDMWLTPGDFKK